MRKNIWIIFDKLLKNRPGSWSPQPSIELFKIWHFRIRTRNTGCLQCPSSFFYKFWSVTRPFSVLDWEPERREERVRGDHVENKNEARSCGEGVPGGNIKGCGSGVIFSDPDPDPTFKDVSAPTPDPDPVPDPSWERRLRSKLAFLYVWWAYDLCVVGKWSLSGGLMVYVFWASDLCLVSLWAMVDGLMICGYWFMPVGYGTQLIYK